MLNIENTKTNNVCAKKAALQYYLKTDLIQKRKGQVYMFLEILCVELGRFRGKKKISLCHTRATNQL